MNEERITKRKLIKEVKPIGIILAIAYLVVIAIWAGISSFSAWNYSNKMSELDCTKPPVQGASKLTGYISERYMTIDNSNVKEYIGSDRGTYVNSFIPENLRANKPEEVSAVIWVNKDKEIAGYYGESFSRAYGYRHTAQIVWFDLETQQILAETVLTGGEPPRTTKGKKDQYGSDISEQSIRSWIANTASSLGY